MSTTTTASKSEFKPALWTPGDWNALFGFGTNILVNMLVLTGLLRFVLKMPDSLVFGRILPALGLMMCLSTFYYAWLAYRLAQQTGRNDVCALPSGVSVPHMFIVTFVVMLPITLKTGDPIKGWSAGLVWVFFQSFILMIGGFIAPYIRKITPRAALLGTLAGVSVTFIAMRPALEMYMTPQIGLVCFAIIMASWFGGVRYPKAIPAGLVAIAVGMLIAWGSNLFGLGLGGLSVKGLGDAFSNFGFSVPIPAFDLVCFRLRLPRHHPGDSDPVRHLRSGRGDGQCRKRRGRGRRRRYLGLAQCLRRPDRRRGRAPRAARFRGPGGVPSGHAQAGLRGAGRHC